MRHCVQRDWRIRMPGWRPRSIFAAVKTAGVAAILSWVLIVSPASALADPDPGVPGAGGQDPTPFTGTAPFGPPSVVPANGSPVGGGPPLIHNFSPPGAD